MLRRILVPLDPSPYTDAALEYGCLIAKQHDAAITGLTVLDVWGVEDAMSPTLYPGLYHAVRRLEYQAKNTRAHTEELLHKFEQKCKQQGVVYRQCSYQGIPSKHILGESIFHDLVVIGFHTDFDFGADPGSDRSLAKILDHSVTPILAVPDTCRWREKTIKTLIAFNGSLPAARALQRFAQLAGDGDYEIILLMSDKDDNIANFYLSRAEAYLHAHTIENVKTVWTPQDIVRSMESGYIDWADLVVAGAHSKKGLVDFMVGSVVKYLIREAKKPIFLGQ